MADDAKREAEAGVFGGVANVIPRWIPRRVSHERTAEARNERRRREAAMAVFAVARGELGEEGVLELFARGALVADQVANILMQRRSEPEADAGVDGGLSIGRAVTLRVARKILPPTDRDGANLLNPRADSGRDKRPRTDELMPVGKEVFAARGLVIQSPVDQRTILWRRQMRRGASGNGCFVVCAARCRQQKRRRAESATVSERVMGLLRVFRLSAVSIISPERGSTAVFRATT